jgi:CPA1 family monovalent cation:H+ antiporter
MTPFDLLALILVAAALIGCANHMWVRLPSAIGLLLGSLALAALVLAVDPVAGGALRFWLRGAMSQLNLPEVFLGGVLGLLLFAATFQVSLLELRDNKWIILLLATGSVILSTVLFGFGLFGICRLAGYDMPLRWCAVIGAILAPTDAVVVDDLLRRVRMPAALRAAIAGESLLNDGAGVVLFVITLHLAGGSTDLIGHGRVMAAMAAEGGGGALLGVAAGLLARRLLARIDHGGLALTVSLALVLVSYRAADALGVSGPIAVVAAGLTFGRGMQTDGSGGADAEVVSFWLLLHEVLNAILFLLIGLQAIEIAYTELAWIPVLASIPLAVLTRLLSTAIPVACLGGGWRSKSRRVAVLTWAGMRGGVSIAMVLATPATPWRGELLAICLTVVLFTVFAQGLTLPWALRRLVRQEPGPSPAVAGH